MSNAEDIIAACKLRNDELAEVISSRFHFFTIDQEVFFRRIKLVDMTRIELLQVSSYLCKKLMANQNDNLGGDISTIWDYAIAKPLPPTDLQ